MTREEAVKIYRGFGFHKTEAGLQQRWPAWFCNQVLDDAAQDAVDAMMALGVLKCDPPEVAKDAPQHSDGEAGRCPSK